MAIDPSIPLGYKEHRINTPFQNLAVVMEARNRQAQARQQELETKQTEQTMADQQALRAIWQQYGDNPEEALKRTKAVNPALGLKMEQEMMQAAIVNMSLQDEQLEREERQHDKHLLRLGSIPQGDDEMYQAARALALKDDPGMDVILPKTLQSKDDYAQLERAMEMGKEARQVISQRRQEVNRLRDDADRKANQEAALEERKAAREERMQYLQDALEQRKASAEQLNAYRQELTQLRRESAGAPVAVVGPDGKPVYVSRSQALGRTPAPGSMGVPVVVQTEQGPQVVDRASGTARPITDQSGEQVKPPKTADMRNREAAMGRLTPLLESVVELSDKINTQQGVIATIAGAAKKAEAKVNLDLDVAEYESMVQAFTPMWARALGHTGVLTQQDVDSAREALPKPGDSKALKDRKLARIEKIIGSQPGASMPGTNQTPPAPTGPATLIYDPKTKTFKKP